MADLSELQSAGVTKIAGANSTTGNEDYFVDADGNGNLKVVDYATGATGSAVPSNATLIGGKNGSGNLTAILVDASGRQAVNLNDSYGNVLTSNNSQLQVRDVLNTAGQNRAQSVTTTAAEALGGSTILANRKVLILTPTNGTIYWGFVNTVTVTTGTPIFKNQTVALAVTDNVHVYVIAASTVDARIAEAS